MSLSFNNLETKHATKNLTTDFTVISIVLGNIQSKNILPYPFKHISDISQLTDRYRKIHYFKMLIYWAIYYMYY